MNKMLKFTIMMLFLLQPIISLNAQAPQAFPYQAVARNTSGSLLSNQTISIRISILDLTNTGTVLYRETHSVTTNSLGLFTLNIGQGNVTLGNFSSIAWASGAKFVKVDMDANGGNTYTTMGTTQLLSVPYALYANVPGVAGPQGAAGVNGKSVLNGTSNPTAGIGVDGDFFINKTTNQIFGPKTAGAWGSGTSLIGPTGAQGIQGIQGLQGATGSAGTNGTNGANGSNGLDGKTILNGTSNPTAGIGVNGDFYINTNSDQIFGPKTAGAWGSGTSLIGPTGAQGIQGIQGLQGATGSAGTNGTNGTNGSNGLDGKTILNGTSNPTAGIGVNGDFYINTNNDQIFGPKTAGAWGSGTSLIGPTGAQGIQGIQGATGSAGTNGTNGANGSNGLDGKTILNGTSNPTAGIGVNGDFYINTNSDQIFGPKTAGAWGSGTSLIGPTGPQGIQGIQGLQGATGSAGTNGSNGLDGKTILNGTSNPTAGIGANGDFYINTNNDQIFGPKTAGAWGSGTSLIGPTGATGAQGIQGLQGATGSAGTNGTNGVDGKTILSGTSNPTAGIGANGDFYININSDQIFGPKTAGAWGSGTSLIGSPGATGSTGPQGTSGLQLITAFNGLSKSNDSLSLGGRLNQHTILSQDNFNFKINDNDAISSTVDVLQSNNANLNNLSGTAITQTYTAISTAKLKSIRLYISAVGGSSISLSLKNNAGITLATQTINYASIFNNWQEFLIPNNVIQQSGLVYTLSVTGTVGTTWYYSGSNIYAGGQASINANRDMTFEINILSEETVFIVKDQKVGIATSTPTSKLDVNGKTRTSLLQLTTGASNGAVLMSDANGNGVWTPFTAIGSGSLDEAYDFGGSGLGRIVTADNGAVKIAGEDGLQVTGTLGNGDDLDISGAGTRMFFNPKKAAFRVGQVDGTQWNKDSVGTHSFASGLSTKAKGNYSSAMGMSSEANSSYSTAIGDHCTSTMEGAFSGGAYSHAGGFSSVAMGYQNSAIGYSSVAMGYSNDANNQGAIAMGQFNSADGEASTATGWSCEAKGGASFATGFHTQANAFCCAVFGKYNDTVVAPMTGGVGTYPIFIVGKGASETIRSNAITVRSDGYVGLGTSTPIYQLELNLNSAAKPSSSSWTISSDARLKTIDGNYSKGLNDILKLNAITYHYKKDNARKLPTDEMSYGFIAQEVQKIFPECVKENEDGYLSLDIHPILVSYINAFKELNAKIDKLQKQQDMLLERLEKLENK